MVQLAKQMTYSRMIEEVEYQRNNKKLKTTKDFVNTPTSSMHVDHLVNDIMIRTLNDVLQQQARTVNEEYFSFIKNDTIIKIKKYKR